MREVVTEVSLSSARNTRVVVDDGVGASGDETSGSLMPRACAPLASMKDEPLLLQLLQEFKELCRQDRDERRLYQTDQLPSNNVVTKFMRS